MSHLSSVLHLLLAQHPQDIYHPTPLNKIAAVTVFKWRRQHWTDLVITVHLMAYHTLSISKPFCARWSYGWRKACQVPGQFLRSPWEKTKPVWNHRSSEKYTPIQFRFMINYICLWMHNECKSWHNWHNAAGVLLVNGLSISVSIHQ